MDNEQTINQDVEKPASYRYGAELPAASALLEELLKETEIQQLFESYYNLVTIPIAIIDLNANVLLSSRWQRICTQFHRVHPVACSRCIESDTQLAMQLKEGKSYSIYPCRNGLTDCASPIILEGKHIANLFIGQFLTAPPDEARFRRQAEEFGFDVVDYLAALHEVPIVDAGKITVIHEFLVRMTSLITNLGIDRKRAIESQARLSIIIDAIPQSVFWKDLDGRYLGCNAAFARAAGFAKQDDVVGKTDFDLPWPRHEAEAYRAGDQAVIAANQSRLHIVEPLQQADGSRIVIDTSKIPLVDAGNIPYGVVGIYDDITERKQAEEELQKHRDHLQEIVAERTAALQASQQNLIDSIEELKLKKDELLHAKERAEAADHLKSAFLATMSHELRTPLNSIIGFTGILLQKMGGPINEEQEKQLSMVRDSANHLLSLISDILDISKIEAGQLTVGYEPFPLNGSIQKVVQSVRPLAEKKGLTLTIELADDVGSMTGDVRRVEQVLLNLLSNAVKFTEQGGISVRCVRGGGNYIVTVHDTGIGISRSDLERLFKPFHQVDTGLSRKYEGTGLGLSICKRLIELMGGSIQVESLQGVGSSFSFSLPVERT